MSAMAGDEVRRVAAAKRPARPALAGPVTLRGTTTAAMHVVGKR